MVKPDYVLILDAHPVDDARIQKHIRFLLDKGYCVYHIHIIPYNVEPNIDDGKYSLYGENAWHINLNWKTHFKGLRLLNYLLLFHPILTRKTIDAMRALGVPINTKGIIHVHDPILLPLAQKICSGYMSGGDIVYDRHEIYEGMKRFLGIGGYSLFEHISRKNVKAVIVVSDHHRDSAEAAFPGALVVTVPNFPLGSMFDQEKICRKIEIFSGNSTILCSYIGSMRNDYDRDISLLLDTSTRLLEKNPRINIIIGGSCNDQDILNRLSILTIRFPGRFAYIGQVTYGEVTRITQDSHIGFYFLKGQETGHVGSPNKIYEYLFCGVIPVVKGRVDYANDFATCSHICSSKEGAEQIAGAVEQIISNVDHTKQLMRCAHDLGQKLSWEHVAGRYLELYENLLQNKEVK